MIVPDDTAVLVMPVPLPEYLDDLENERRYIMARLRRIEMQLIRHGRLNEATLKERIR